METIETKRRFIELRAKGYSFDKIAMELGKAVRCQTKDTLYSGSPAKGLGRNLRLNLIKFVKTLFYHL